MVRAVNRIFAWPRLLALLGGLGSALAFEPLGLWPLGLLALALLIELIGRAETWRRAFVLGWLFGFAQFTLGLNWLVTAFGFQAALPPWLGWVAVAGLAAYLAIWPGLSAAAAFAVGRTNRAALVLAMAGCWILGEWLRGWVFTGFPWNPLAAITLKSFANPGLAMSAKWLGTYALSGLVVLLAGGLLLAAHRRRGDWQTALLALGPIALFLLPAATDQREGRLAYTLVQANLSQDSLHDPESYADQFRRSSSLSLARRPGQRRVVFWPESGVPVLLKNGYPTGYYAAFNYTEDPVAARASLARVAGEGGLLLTGNTELVLDGSKLVGARNSVTAIDSRAAIRGFYYKSHLVPFGEYVPLSSVLEPLGLARFVPGDIAFIPGPGPRTIDFGPWGKAGIGVCYEVIFPGAQVDRADRPDYMFNPSNDGWYGAWGPPQHLAQARLRAIEEGLPLIRATTTGISAVIDASGAVRAAIGLDKAERRDGMIPPALPPTLFAQYGNPLSLVWAIALLGLSLVARRRLRE